MPIAHCVVMPGCKGSGDNLIELWAEASGQPSEHMTVNILEGKAQWGKAYRVTVTLWLPSMWSGTDIAALQLGLAEAVTAAFGVSADEVLVLTRIVDSGLVVEGGRIVEW